jgi:predicted DNA-binding protein
MRAISLKIAESTLQEAERLARLLGMPRAAYIRKAIERFNRQSAAEIRAQRLADASRKVRAESMRINAEFAAIEKDPDA